MTAATPILISQGVSDMSTAAENYLKHLQDEVDRLRAAGIEPSRELLDSVKAQRERVELDNNLGAKRKAENEAAKALQAKAYVDRIAEVEKAEARQAWLASGGLSEEFETAWPELRMNLIKARTLSKLVSTAESVTPKL